MDFQKYLNDGYLEPDLIAEDIGIKGRLLYSFIDVNIEGYKSIEEIRSCNVQSRLRDMIHIIDQAESRFHSLISAYAWFQSEPLPGFSSKTAMQLVQEGRSKELLDYMKAIDAGVYV